MQPTDETDVVWTGRVVRGDRGRVRVSDETGRVLDVWVRATADAAAMPCVGDWVRVVDQGDDAHLVEVLARHTLLERAEPGGSSRHQALAANVDVVGVVVGLDQLPSLDKIERLLVVAWASGADVVVVLSKADAAADALEVAEDVALELAVRVVVSSARTGQGLDDLRALADGRTLALLGSSGAGKSSLANALASREATATAAIRSDGRGRHTTVRRELVALAGGGSVVDTPGVRGVGVIDPVGLAEAFSDVEDLASGCRFGDCSHEVEPGCAVREALADGRLSVRRFESWRALSHEATWQEQRADARVAAEQNRARRRETRAIRRAFGHDRWR